MSWLRCSSFLVVVAALTACSSTKSTTPTGTSGGTSGTATSGGTSGDTSGSASGCTVTFGGDAATVKTSSCHQLGPLVDDSPVVLSFNGDATGLDSPIFVFSFKFPGPPAAKTYQTADLFYVSDNIAVTSTGKTYAVDFDSSDATKMRDGSVTATFTSVDHGTIDVTLDSTDAPVKHATAHITF